MLPTWYAAHMSVPMSRSAPGPFSLRPLRTSSLAGGQPEGRPIQATPDDGPPSGHPHLGGRAPATYDAPINFRALPIEQRTQYAIQRPSDPVQGLTSSFSSSTLASQASQPPMPAIPDAVAEEADSPTDPHTAEQDPYDAPPAQGPPSATSSIYGGVVNDAAASSPAPEAAPVAATSPAPAPQPVVVASRPASVVAVAGSTAGASFGSADIEIEVRGQAGNRVVTIRLRS